MPTLDKPFRKLLHDLLNPASGWCVRFDGVKNFHERPPSSQSTAAEESISLNAKLTRCYAVAEDIELDAWRKSSPVSEPEVSVVMPVHNGAPFLRQAIDSILQQTFGAFEFIIVDDGSTDDSPAILADYQGRDKRIRIHRQAQAGPAGARNTAIELARCEYVAVMDADDISLPRRLALQVAFMKANSKIGICGSWIKTLGAGSHVLYYETDDAVLRSQVLFQCPMAHPSVMLRRKLFVDAGLFYQDSCYVEDYELWTRAARVCSFANIPRILLHYRHHSSQISQRRFAVQMNAARNLRITLLGLLDISPTETEADLHETISYRYLFPSLFRPRIELLDHADAWLKRLQVANSKKNVFPESGFSRALSLQWYRLCSASVVLGPKLWLRAQSSEFARQDRDRFRNMIKLAIKYSVGRTSLRTRGEPAF